MTVIAYPPKTSGDEMCQNRQARRIECNATLACACGNRCPICRNPAHIVLERTGSGRRLRCAGCGAEYTGSDMFRVIDREGTGEHVIGVLSGLLRCGCEAGRWRRECWALERVRAYLRREAERTPVAPETPSEPPTDELFAMLGDDPRPALRVVQ